MTTFLIVSGAALILSVVGAIRYFLRIVIVEGSSMTPTLLPGDRLLAMRVLSASQLRRGRIVVVDARKVPNACYPQRMALLGYASGARAAHVPLATGQRPGLYIKRIVGVPGDVLSEHVPAVEAGNRSQGRLVEVASTRILGEGEYFLQGDGLFSTDSRQWGPVPLSAIEGVVVKPLARRASGIPFMRAGGEAGGDAER